jgi:ATP-dependent protease ClpP protease subunit
MDTRKKGPKMKKSILIAALISASIVTAKAELIFTDVPSPLMNGSVEGAKLVSKLKGMKDGDANILYFNALGGEVAEGFKIGAELNKNSHRTVCVLKTAGSMAAILLGACTNIKLLDNSKVLIHAARDKDKDGKPVFDTEDVKKTNEIFKKVLAPILTEEEMTAVFVDHKDLIMSGEEYVTRRRMADKYSTEGAAK